MTANELSFLTDENIDHEVVNFLRKQGFDVLDIKEEGLFSMSDHDILQMAWQQNRVVISQDSDFGTLIFRDKVQVCGVVYLRPGHESPNVHVETMEAIFSAELDFVFPFMLVSENNDGYVKIRMRYLNS